MSAKAAGRRTGRRVDVMLRTVTEQKWGDSYNQPAPSTDTVVILRHTIPLIEPRDARHALGRLLFAKMGTNDVAGNLVTGEEPVRFSEDEPARHYEAEARFHVFPRDKADQVLAQVKAYADELRTGKHDPPTITVEQSRLFSELGIALRADGVFGYKRKCAREACNEPGGSNDCFGSLDPTEAIAGARKRDRYTCSTACWIEIGWAKDWGIDEKVLEYLRTVEGAREDLEAAGCLTLDDDGEPALVDDWWTKAKAHDDARWRVLEVAGELTEDTDDDGNEDAIECEVGA